MPVKERTLSHGTQTDFIQCNVCKFTLICPHIRDLMELERKRKTDEDVRRFIFKYAGETPLYLKYYCRICGEPISDTSEASKIVEFVDGQKVHYGSVEDTLRDEIWKETSFIVRSFVEFKGLQTNKYINRFVDTLVNGIYQFIYAIEKKLLKAKTSSLEEINEKKKLFTIVYVMALIAKAINDNPTLLKFTHS